MHETELRTGGGGEGKACMFFVKLQTGVSADEFFFSSFEFLCFVHLVSRPSMIYPTFSTFVFVLLRENAPFPAQLKLSLKEQIHLIKNVSGC